MLLFALLLFLCVNCCCCCSYFFWLYAYVKFIFNCLRCITNWGHRSQATPPESPWPPWFLICFRIFRIFTFAFSFFFFSFFCNWIYLCYGIFARPIDDVVQRPFAAHIIDAHELQQGGVYEAHADAVPDIHRGQVGDDGQRAAETVRGSEEIQHCCHA